MTRPTSIEVSEVRVRLSRHDDLVGWASCLVNGALYLNNIVVKSGRDGLYLHFPRVVDKPHFVFNPISADALKAFEDAIFVEVEKQMQS